MTPPPLNAMDTNRKASPRSPLKMLPPEDQERLAVFLRTNNLAAGVEFCAAEFKLKTNDSSLSSWLAWFATMAELRSYNDNAEEVAAELSKTSVDPELIPKLATVYFIQRAANSGDAKTFAAAAAVVQRDMEIKAAAKQHEDKLGIAQAQVDLRQKTLTQLQRKLDQSERKVAALEAKAAEAKAAAERAKGILSSGGMDDAKRAAFMAEMDVMILGKKRKPAAADKPAAPSPA